MNREEAVLLVSRALACMQAISALLYASYLPERLLSLHHYTQLQSEYFTAYDRVQIAFYFGRIAFLLLMTFVFWNCGPGISRFLLPEPKSPPPTS